MICKAEYEKKEDIPDGLESEFEFKNNKYFLKESSIDGGDTIFVAGAVANKERAIKQLTTKKEELKAATDKVTDLEKQLAAVKDSDGTVLNSEDTRAFNEYKALGAVKEIQKIVKEYPELKTKVVNDEKTGTLQKFSENTGLNLEVLKDWAFDSSKGNGIEFYTKDEIEKINNVDTKVTKPMIRLSQKDDATGSVTVTEHDLMDIAKNRLSSYQVEALLKPNTDSGDKPKPGDKPRVHIPNFTSTNQKPAGDSAEPKKPVEQFNAERANKPSPFDAPSAAAI